MEYSDPFQWTGIDALKPNGSIRNNPEFQEILSQLQKAESFGWNMTEQNQTQLAASLSEFLFKSMKDKVHTSSTVEPDGDDDDSEEEIDYIKLAELN